MVNKTVLLSGEEYFRTDVHATLFMNFNHGFIRDYDYEWFMNESRDRGGNTI